MYFGIVINNIDERSLLPILDGNVRDHELIGQGIHQQPYIHELQRKKRIVFVIEYSLQLRRSRGGIDLVIEGHKHPGRQFLGVVAIVGIYWQMHPSSQLLGDLRKVVLGNGKERGYGLELRDHDHAIRIGSMNDVAGIYEAEPDDTGNRSGDLGINQLQLGVVDVGHILLDGAFILRDQGSLGIQLLFRNRVGLEQLLVTSEIEFGVVQQS